MRHEASDTCEMEIQTSEGIPTVVSKHAGLTFYMVRSEDDFYLRFQELLTRIYFLLREVKITGL